MAGRILELTGPFFPQAEETPAGSEVVVQPEDPETGSAPVVLTFEEITEGGYTGLQIGAEGPPSPDGFAAGEPQTYYDLNTTAGSEGPVTVCVDYSGTIFAYEDRLRLFHFEDGAWVDVTTSLDEANQMICGSVSSLSPFAVFEWGTPPEVEPIAAAPEPPISIGTVLEVSARFADPDIGDEHAAVWDWGDGTTGVGIVTGPADEVPGSATGRHLYSIPGVHAVALTVTDRYGGSDAVAYQYVAVYDPEGFATGGGWIDSPAGAYAADPEHAGKGHFSFNPQYDPKKGTLKGKAQFKVADMDFRSTELDWLVVDGPRVWLHGAGGIKGEDGIWDFLMTAIDGEVDGAEDTFRIRIQDPDGHALLYDSQREDTPEADPATALGGGSIVVHPAGAAERVVGETLPVRYALESNFPNPFNPRTHIRFALPEAATVTLEVYNAQGQKVATLVDGEGYDAGYYEASFEADGLASGVYFYRIDAGRFRRVRKMTLIR